MHDNSLKELTDGQLFRSNVYFTDNQNDVPLIMYSDAVELVNPIGPGRSKHKVVQVFGSLGSLPKRHRSKVDRLQLGLVFKEKLLKRYSYRQILRVLVQDLKNLEQDGVTLKEPCERTVKAGLLIYEADNLEQHLMGGFSASFSSNYICRFCHSKHEDLLNNIHYYSGTSAYKTWSISEYDGAAEDHTDLLEEDNSIIVTRENLFDEYDEPLNEEVILEEEEDALNDV